MKYILILIFSFSALSFEYTIRNKKMQFVFKDKKLVSKNCEKNCEALKAKVTQEQIDNFDRENGKNPATAACKVAKGEIVKAESALGHETFFCKFKDKSYIHSGHLL